MDDFPDWFRRTMTRAMRTDEFNRQLREMPVHSDEPIFMSVMEDYAKCQHPFEFVLDPLL